MNKKNRPLKLILITLLLLVAFAAFKFLGPAAQSPKDGFLYIKTGTTADGLKKELLQQKIIKNLTWYNITTRLLSINKVKPGKYKISPGMSMVSLVRMLRNGRQTPVEFIITKIRTKEQLAARLGKAFEFDSLAAITFLNSNDSLQKYNLDSNTAMSAALPLTYESKWNTTPREVFDKFYAAFEKFWTDERKQQAATKNLSIVQVATLASIIDEETNIEADKENVASVYLNRIKKGMPLQADPTVKFALKDFGLKRIIHKHLAVASPYNTYKNRGLPPGPICTPQVKTIDAVLKSPDTEYIYFVASPAFDGTHIFTTNYADHLKHARAYQQALNERFGKISDTSKK